MIIPTILEKDLFEIKNKIAIAEKFAPLIQIDFVDGIAAEGGPTFLDAQTISKIKTSAKLELDLMVANPLDYLSTKMPNVVKVCTLLETDFDHDQFISQAKKLDYKVGFSIGPQTNYEQLENYLDRLDFVQFMQIEPGAQGRKSIPEVLNKILNFTKKFPHMKTQADGGVNDKSAKKLFEAGVDDLVCGSYIFNSTNPKQKYIELDQMTKPTISSLKENRIQKIAILGGAAWLPTDEVYQQAFDVCKVLAEAGYEIVNGGGPGVMQASTKGAHAGGGKVLAITYHPNKPKRHYEGVGVDNDFDDEVITLDYFDRTKVMLQTTQMHIVFKGSLGTLSEFGMTWISSWIHEPDNKPIILYGEFWNDYLDVIDKHAVVGEDEKSMLKVCRSPEEVLEFTRGLEG